MAQSNRYSNQDGPMRDAERVFCPDDPDFPTTPALRERLKAAGKVVPLPAARPANGHSCNLCGIPLASDADADTKYGLCGSCKRRPDGLRLIANKDEAGIVTPGRVRRDFTPAELSLISKARNHMPIERLLSVLNDRLRGDLGGVAELYTMDQLLAVLADDAAPGADDPQQWGALRRVLASARASGTLSRITRETIDDFAVVFSLNSRQVLFLVDTLLDDGGEP